MPTTSVTIASSTLLCVPSDSGVVSTPAMSSPGTFYYPVYQKYKDKLDATSVAQVKDNGINRMIVVE